MIDLIHATIIGLLAVAILTGPIALIGVWLLGCPYRNREKDLRK